VADEVPGDLVGSKVEMASGSPPLSRKYRKRPIMPGQAAANDEWLAGQLVRVTIPAAASFFDCRPSAYE
jgi:hypothetical protein